MTSMMIVGGVECYFDPQIEAVLVGNTGKNEHKRFCRPRAEMTKEYIVYGDDIAISYALFGAFSYDAAKMAKLPTPCAQNKTARCGSCNACRSDRAVFL